MKTSNKILLGSFLFALLIITSVHVAVYAKYKSGQYTLVGDEMWSMDLATHLLKDVKYISLDNIENIDVRASDTSKIQYEKVGEKEENQLSFTQRGDTLFVLSANKTKAPGRWYKKTELLLAKDLSVSVRNSRVHVRNEGQAVPFSLHFRLDDSSIDLDSRREGKGNFGLVKLDVTNRSRIDLGDVKINHLDVSLTNSSIEERELFADSINIKTDAASTINLRGENLIKAKLTAHE